MYDRELITPYIVYYSTHQDYAITQTLASLIITFLARPQISYFLECKNVLFCSSKPKVSFKYFRFFSAITNNLVLNKTTDYELPYSLLQKRFDHMYF